MKITKHPLPCSCCGGRDRAVSMYIQAEADSRVALGFYPGLLVFLCRQCLIAALSLLEEPKEDGS